LIGSLHQTYNEDFRVVATRINEAHRVEYAYDPDGLLIQAGALQLTYDTQNGLLTGTELAAVTTQRRYNAFGEVVEETAEHAGRRLYHTQYQYDKLARITQKTETVLDETTVYTYTYDLAWRLFEVKENDVVTEHYEYDANGNRLKAETAALGVAEGVYDDQDRLNCYGDATY
jgi:YD repeat-containing protein